MQNLNNTIRPHEENMLLLMNIYPNISGVTISGSHSTSTMTTSTTTAKTIRTTSEKPQLKRKKERVCKKSKRKHSRNKQLKSFPESCCEKNDSESKSTHKESINLCLKQQINYTIKHSHDAATAVCSYIHSSQQKHKMLNNQKSYGYAAEIDLNMQKNSVKEIAFFLPLSSEYYLQSVLSFIIHGTCL